jgi:hypothetical protein
MAQNVSLATTFWVIVTGRGPSQMRRCAHISIRIFGGPRIISLDNFRTKFKLLSIDYCCPHRGDILALPLVASAVNQRFLLFSQFVRIGTHWQHFVRTTESAFRAGSRLLEPFARSARSRWGLFRWGKFCLCLVYSEIRNKPHRAVSSGSSEWCLGACLSSSPCPPGADTFPKKKPKF